MTHSLYCSTTEHIATHRTCNGIISHNISQCYTIHSYSHHECKTKNRIQRQTEKQHCTALHSIGADKIRLVYSADLIECPEERREQQVRSCVVEEAMNVVVQVAKCVVVCEWRCDDSVHNNELFLGDDGIQSFSQGGPYRQHSLLSCDCRHTVAHSHQ